LNIKANFRKNGKYYSTWEIGLHKGNNPKWLIKHKAEMIEYIKKDLGFNQVRSVRLVNMN